MARAKIGDVVEIKTSKGIAYAHYTHHNKEYGALLRVFSQFYDVRPDDFTDLVSGDPTFMTFFPLNAAFSRHIVSVAGNVPVPANAQQFPIFRSTGNVDDVTRKSSSWWLWDGDKEWFIGDLPQQLRRLSIRGIVNDTMLIHEIESGWKPEDDPWL